MQNLRLILVSPKFSGNIGSVARVAANFGVHDFVIVAPQCDVFGEEAFLYATGASKEILLNVRVVDSIPQAIEDCHASLAIARRFGDQSPQTLPLLDLPGWIAERSRPSAKIAILFGREDNCLTREELMHCTHQVGIPTSDFMPTMNLSHAVAVVLFEIFSRLPPNQNTPKNFDEELATQNDFEDFIDHWRNLIRDADAFANGNQNHVLKRITRAWQKATLSKQDIAAFRAVLSKVQVALGTRKRKS